MKKKSPYLCRCGKDLAVCGACGRGWAQEKQFQAEQENHWLAGANRARAGDDVDAEGSGVCEAVPGATLKWKDLMESLGLCETSNVNLMCYSFSFIGNPDPLGTLHYMGHSLLNQKCICKYHKNKSSKKQCFHVVSPRRESMRSC